MKTPIQIIQDILEDVYGKVIPEKEPLELDSLTLVTLIEKTERLLDVRIQPEDLIPENFESIQAIAQLVANKQGAV